MISSRKDRIMCMQHCSSSLSIFFLDFPARCPVCNAELKKCQLIIPPFCLPCPLSSGHDPLLRCSVLIKPTKGDFLRSYVNGDNLHIGISNSRGFIYNYDERGLIVESSNWDKCARLDVTCHDTEHWDSVLESSCQSDYWTTIRYKEDTYNCYTYVLKMLNNIHNRNFNQDNKAHFYREEFCRLYIIPVTTRIAKYIDLFRNIETKGTVVQQTAVK